MIVQEELRMKFKLAVFLFLALLTGPAAAVQVQSTTSVLLTFRQCVEGETACDSISGMRLKSFGGLPGAPDAQASQEDAEYGSANGNANLADGNMQMNANISSLPGARNGGNVFFLQRYENTSEHEQKLTLDATLTFDQTVPAENADFTDASGAQSVVGAELEIFTLSVDAVEAGTTAEDNHNVFQSGPPPEAVYTSVADAAASGTKNATGQGSKTFSVSGRIPPGESVWIFGVLQTLGANGAVIKGRLETRSTIE